MNYLIMDFPAETRSLMSLMCIMEMCIMLKAEKEQKISENKIFKEDLFFSLLIGYYKKKVFTVCFARSFCGYIETTRNFILSRLGFTENPRKI